MNMNICIVTIKSSSLLILFNLFVYFSIGETSLFFYKQNQLFTHNFNIYHLNDTGYNEIIHDQNTIFLVDFYDPWSLDCVHFAPEFEAVSDHYAISEHVKVGVIDCSQHLQACSLARIKRYPAVHAFHVTSDSNQSVAYNPNGGGSLDAKGVIDWLNGFLRSKGIETMEYEPAGKKTSSETKKLEDASVHAVSDRYVRLRDAGMAFVFILDHAMFLGVKVIEGDRYVAALKWLDASKAAFPLECNRNAIAKLQEMVLQQNSWTIDEWDHLMTKWKEYSMTVAYPSDLFTRVNVWEHCLTFTCGLWTLLHEYTVNLNEKNFIKPADIVDAIRDFIQFFFGCEQCRYHFMKANPPSIIDKIGNAQNSYMELALWIWKMHNIVNRVIAKDPWPSKRECSVCYDHTGSFKLEKVYEYMKNIYKIPETDRSKEAYNALVHAGHSVQRNVNDFWEFDFYMYSSLMGVIMIFFFMLRSYIYKKATHAHKD